jgi:hypothetical protein
MCIQLLKSNYSSNKKLRADIKNAGDKASLEAEGNEFSLGPTKCHQVLQVKIGAWKGQLEIQPDHTQDMDLREFHKEGNTWNS